MYTLKRMVLGVLWLLGIGSLLMTGTTQAQEKRLTFGPHCYDLDNNDNFSPDGQWLCFDARETIGPGIQHSQFIGMVNVESGKDKVLYAPPVTVIGSRPAPGCGAVSFNGAAMEVAFIHGPPVEELGTRGPYDFPNRGGGHVKADGKQKFSWLDHRDITTDRDTLPGAHRGGTHRHEYTWNGNRIGFTYNDFLMKEYDRTVGYMEPRDDAPGDASHYFVLMVPVVPMGTSKPGELEKAWGDSWVGRDGAKRAFIGKVRAADGESFEQSLFIADVPLDIDITTADSGSATRFPTPPKGITIRRLTRDWADGTVRGTPDGNWVAYYGKAEDDTTQIFIIKADGSGDAIQATTFEHGVSGGLRWHPSGNSILCESNNGITSTCVVPGDNFGKSVFLTDQGTGATRKNLVISFDGTMLAWNQQAETKDKEGQVLKNYLGQDFLHIFTLPYPDNDGDGVVD